MTIRQSRTFVVVLSVNKPQLESAICWQKPKAVNDMAAKRRPSDRLGRREVGTLMLKRKSVSYLKYFTRFQNHLVT